MGVCWWWGCLIHGGILKKRLGLVYDFRNFGCPKCIARSFDSGESDGFCSRKLYRWASRGSAHRTARLVLLLLGGIQAYANEVKEGLLGVSHDTLVSFGAVSEEVASEMARGVQRLTGSDWAISTTGVAGPDGGSDEAGGDRLDIGGRLRSCI